MRHGCHVHLTALFAIGQLEQRPALLVKHSLVALQALAVSLLLRLPGGSLLCLFAPCNPGSRQSTLTMVAFENIILP